MDGAMKQKPTAKTKRPAENEGLSGPRLKKFVEELKARPELFEQFESILGLASAGEGEAPWRTADEVESLLVEEVRKLGHQTMQHWAQGAQARALEDCRKEHPKARVKKKSC
jgi:hypothetical protein